jgi:FAD/FMN-containing dehydrogenase
MSQDQVVSQDQAFLVNDVHSHFNPTWVERVVLVGSLVAIRQIVATAREEGKSLCIAGSRHAMGAQQFGSGSILLDVRPLCRMLAFNAEQGTIEVEAGIQWPQLIECLDVVQKEAGWRWTIAQKQTGADFLTLGGALSANVHGRGLRMKPIISDVESFVLVDAQGAVHTCSRTQNSQLFRLVIGGYGLFGVIYSVTLRLVARCKVRRVVEILQDIASVESAFQQRIADGYLYGDFQFDVDAQSPHFLQRGVFSCYVPVTPETPIPDDQKVFSEEDWLSLLYLAHTDKARAYSLYTDHYRATSGQIYWSDTHQLSFYDDGYHLRLDQQLSAAHPGSEMITELYVPRVALPDFMRAAADLLRRTQSSVVYGTVRLIEQDDESFLAWAKCAYACIVFNLHVDHSPEGLEEAQTSLCALIDLAIGLGGSFYLTYHKFATKQQVETCYPQFRQFLELKRRYDPDEIFQSDWYRHYKELLSDRVLE